MVATPSNCAIAGWVEVCSGLGEICNGLGGVGPPQRGGEELLGQQGVGFQRKWVRECKERILGIFSVLTRKNLKREDSSLGKLGSAGEVLCPFRDSRGLVCKKITKNTQQLFLQPKQSKYKCFAISPLMILFRAVTKNLHFFSLGAIGNKQRGWAP